MPIEKKQICITGGAGFIGSTLAGVLAEKNKVVIFDNLDRNAISSCSYANHENIKLICGDILDFPAVVKAVEGADLIVHCAGVAGIDTVIKSPTRTLKVNIIGSDNVLEAARQVGGVQRLVCFSTSEVFGSQAFSSKETDKTVIGAVGQARWTYAASKLAEEHLAISYFLEYGLPTTVLRPFNIYGPKQVGEGALKAFVQRALRDETLYIYGLGTQIRAWCYIDDMIEAILCMLENPRAVGESFNIGNARSVETILGLANTVIRILGSKSKIEFRPALSADIELRIPCVAKAEEFLGFTSKIDLQEGIERTAAFYRELL